MPPSLPPQFQYLSSLVDDALAITGGHTGDGVFELGDVEEGSQFQADDQRTAGYWVSMAALHSLTAAGDHALALRSLLISDAISNMAIWTLTRAILESASTALWIISPEEQESRLLRNFSYWRYDYDQRERWAKDHNKYGIQKVSHSESLNRIETAIVALASAKKVPNFNYADAVSDAGKSVGYKEEFARARWREASGFAHGRTWASLNLSQPRDDATLIKGGVRFTIEFKEESHKPVAELTTRVFGKALIMYSELAGAAT